MVVTALAATLRGHMTLRDLLNRYPATHTQNFDEMRDDLIERAGALRVDVQRDVGHLDARINRHSIDAISLFYATFGVPARVEFPESNFFRLQIVLSGSAEAISRGAPMGAMLSESIVVASGEIVVQNSSVDCTQLGIRIRADSLLSKFEALTGYQPGNALKFDTPTTILREQARTVNRLVLLLASELDSIGPSINPMVFAEIEQAIIVAFLCACPHNFSHLLNGNPRAVAPWQVRIAEEFIAANWNRAISIESLATAVGCSVRSIFRSFRDSRGQSPLAFVKRTRFDHAREMLHVAHANTTISSVALACGFQNMSHFARDYRKLFGELPSETLARGKGTPKTDLR
jgi:AraC-like DNA-binding protein